MVRYNNSKEVEWTKGESWSLGDSPAVAIALNPWCGHYKEIVAPIIRQDTSSSFENGDSRNLQENAADEAEKSIRPKITIYTDVDSRYILGDMIAKIRLFTGE